MPPRVNTPSYYRARNSVLKPHLSQARRLHCATQLSSQTPSLAGAASTLRYFQELSEGVDGLEVVVADMSHTEHGCFDECTMGPNVRFDGEPRTDSGRVVNGVKGAAAIAELLGVDVPEGYK